MSPRPVVILGAGINGCALARELLLNGVPVTLIDTADLSYGATAYSSRLIHGGLRYLEYGELDLVRESLAERSRLLRLAPQFVRPLQLFIPTANRWGGLCGAIGRLVGRRWWPAGGGGQRGMFLIRAGLALYDAYARDPSLPRHQIFHATAPDAVPVDRSQFRWLAAYYDAQILFPERFVIALLADARQIAAASGIEFHLFTYHRARLSSDRLTIEPVATSQKDASVAELKPSDSLPGTREIEPAAIVNATGAWVDRTWHSLGVAVPRLMGGTKGSHFFTFHAGLRSALAGRGLYAEAADGRPIFVTPLADLTLVGTTDEPFEEDPAKAIAREDELQYLLHAVNHILPQVGLTRHDIAFSYSGVRPLPYVDAATPGAVTRRHWIQRHEVAGHEVAGLPCYSIIGGKLTTCRSLAEQSVGRILVDLGLPLRTTSGDRPLPGGDNYPADETCRQTAWHVLAERFKLPARSVRAVWSLYGTRAGAVLAAAEAIEAESGGEHSLVPDIELPSGLIRWIIRHEWVETLDDLVERRLMLLYDQRLSGRCLNALAELLVIENRLPADQSQQAVDATVARLVNHFGKQFAP